MTGGKSHRQTLIDTLSGLSAGGSDSTPTATIFAETYAYLLGSTTIQMTFQALIIIIKKICVVWGLLHLVQFRVLLVVIKDI